MDDERILRKVKPTLVIATSMTIKRWVEEQARLRETTQAEIVNEALLDRMSLVGSEERELAEMAS